MLPAKTFRIQEVLVNWDFTDKNEQMPMYIMVLILHLGVSNALLS